MHKRILSYMLTLLLLPASAACDQGTPPLPTAIPTPTAQPSPTAQIVQPSPSPTAAIVEPTVTVDMSPPTATATEAPTVAPTITAELTPAPTLESAPLPTATAANIVLLPTQEPPTVPALPTETSVPLPTVQPPTQPPVVVEEQAVWVASASVSNTAPTKNSNVRVTGKLLKNGKPFAGAVMNTTWNYKSKDTPCDGAKTKADGTAGCSNNIGSATAGYEVVISVSFLVDNKVVATASTSFTPR